MFKHKNYKIVYSKILHYDNTVNKHYTISWIQNYYAPTKENNNFLSKIKSLFYKYVLFQSSAERFLQTILRVYDNVNKNCVFEINNMFDMRIHAHLTKDQILSKTFGNLWKSIIYLNSSNVIESELIEYKNYKIQIFCSDKNVSLLFSRENNANSVRITFNNKEDLLQFFSEVINNTNIF